MPREFELRKEIELDATPEQVWEAIATGPGNDSWFMGRNEIEPHQGGATRLTIGDHTEGSTVTGWDPQKRFAHRTATQADGTFMAIEYLIEGRDGGATVLRLVHSGILGDDWEEQYDALNEGWNMYLHKLDSYLRYFPGQTATAVSAMQPQAGDPEHMWATLRAGLGLPDQLAVGDRVRLSPAGLAPIEGVVDYLTPHFFGVRGGDGIYRFIHGMNNTVVLGHHIFPADADAQDTEAWQSWLSHLFA